MQMSDNLVEKVMDSSRQLPQDLISASQIAGLKARETNLALGCFSQFSQGAGHRAEYDSSVSARKQFLACPLRMGHHAQYVPLAIADPGNVVQRAIRVGIRPYIPVAVRIPEDDPILFS